jgi:hypothetical protein
VLKFNAMKIEDPNKDPRFGRVGTQTIKDNGSLTEDD